MLVKIGWIIAMHSDAKANGSTETVMIDTEGGRSNFKKETNIISDRYTPPAVATNSCIAKDNGDALVFASVIDCRLWQTRSHMDHRTSKKTDDNSPAEYILSLLM